MPAAVPLDDFLAHLNMRSDSPDAAEAQVHLEAATEAAEARVGPILARTVSARCSSPVVLPQVPASSVVSAASVYGGTSYAAADLDLDGAAGLLRLASGAHLPAGEYVVTYEAGRAADHADVPAALRLAVMIIGKHLWETQRGRTARPGVLGHASGREEERIPIGFALPRRAVQLLQPFMTPTVA